MVFTSLIFLILLLSSCLIFQLCKNIQQQNALIFISSCIFYGYWSVNFLFLMLFMSIAAYGCSLLLNKTSDVLKRKVIFVFSIVFILLFLLYFKYMNFFYSIVLFIFPDDFASKNFEIILPLAISFHVFQLIAYIADVFQKKISAERNLLTFMTFSFFFPQLVAGPIERAKDLLAQIKTFRHVEYDDVFNGVVLIIYGFFVKIVIADALARGVDAIFEVPTGNAISTILGTVAFGLQIYCDFMGYSLIAKGAAHFFGISLSWNFNLPYWSKSPQEFWRRWHITLSTWIRDYLYFPLGGSKGGTWRTCFNLLTTMSLAGLWHGASWNFVIWGCWHGIFLVLHRFWSKYITEKLVDFRIYQFFSWLFTMLVVFCGWYFFRLNASGLIVSMQTSFQHWDYFPVHWLLLRAIVLVSAFLYIFERPLFMRSSPMPFGGMSYRKKTVVLGIMVFFTMMLYDVKQVPFIYFQF